MLAACSGERPGSSVTITPESKPPISSATVTTTPEFTATLIPPTRTPILPTATLINFPTIIIETKTPTPEVVKSVLGTVEINGAKVNLDDALAKMQNVPPRAHGDLVVLPDRLIMRFSEIILDPSRPLDQNSEKVVIPLINPVDSTKIKSTMIVYKNVPIQVLFVRPTGQAITKAEAFPTGKTISLEELMKKLNDGKTKFIFVGVDLTNEGNTNGRYPVNKDARLGIGVWD